MFEFIIWYGGAALLLGGPLVVILHDVIKYPGGRQGRR